MQESKKGVCWYKLKLRGECSEYTCAACVRCGKKDAFSLRGGDWEDSGGSADAQRCHRTRGVAQVQSTAMPTTVKVEHLDTEQGRKAKGRFVSDKCEGSCRSLAPKLTAAPADGACPAQQFATIPTNSHRGDYVRHHRR